MVLHIACLRICALRCLLLYLLVGGFRIERDSRTRLCFLMLCVSVSDADTELPTIQRLVRDCARIEGAGKENLSSSVGLSVSAAKDRKARNRLFSSSESESDDSGVDGNEGMNEHHPSDREATTTQQTNTPPTRAFSMLGGRSVSAKASGSSSASMGRNGGNANGSSSDLRRKTMSSSSSSFKAGSGATASGRESANSSFIGGSGFPERKGLFEQDDEPDSMENFHERVKIRQMKKQSEMETTKAELESAQQRMVELEQRVAQEVKEKEECEIRMKECHRIIEKRNKQLMKASERVARYTEQAESQLAELQTKLTQLTAENDQLRAYGAKQNESIQKEMDGKTLEYQKQCEAKLAEQKQAFEARLARMTHISEESLQAKQSDNEALRARIKQLEGELVGVASRTVTSDEYQSLLKKCEDAEAIGRGLKFQLEKDQQEKKFLKNQLTSLQSSVGFSDTLEAKDDQSSPTSSVASGTDLSSFDFTRQSMLGSPVHKSAPKSPSRKRAEFFAPRIDTDDKLDAESSYARNAAHENESVTSQRTPKPKEEQPAVIPPSPVEEKAPMARSGSSSTNFFEKLSIKFKRSSPRSSFSTKADKPEEHASPSAPSPAASGGSPSNAPAPVRTTSRRQRPKMYVAKAPSNYDEESSDSIFGDDSDSAASSSEGESPPMPPPPPEVPGKSVAASQPSLFGPHQVVPSDDSDDADLSSSSDSEEDTTATSSKPKENTLREHAKKEEQRAARSDPSDSSSDDSDDEKNDSEVEKGFKESKRKRTMGPRESDASSSEDSSSSDDDERDVDRHRRRRDTEEESHKKQSRRGSSVPRSREKSHSTGDEMGNLAHTSKSRMNEYMEARAKKRLEKLKKKEEKENAEHKKKEEYEKEWEKMAQEERERKRKQQQARRSGRRRPSSLKTVRVSQMRQQMNKQQQQKEQQQDQGSGRPDDAAEEDRRRQSSRRKSGSKASESEEEEEESSKAFPAQPSESTPLPPEPTEADTELYLRQQARLRERHEIEMKKRLEADEADLVRGQIHRRVEMWAFGKELLHMILTLDQISSNEALEKCQLSVIQSPDNETVRKAYR